MQVTVLGGHLGGVAKHSLWVEELWEEEETTVNNCNQELGIDHSQSRGSEKTFEWEDCDRWKLEGGDSMVTIQYHVSLNTVIVKGDTIDNDSRRIGIRWPC